MNTNLKIALALALVLAAVVGVTVITQFAGSEPDPKQTDSPGKESVRGTAGDRPLTYENGMEPFVFYDPTDKHLVRREFPGYFEVNKTVHWATFWFRNTGPAPVKLTARGRSCSACSQARVAWLSPAECRGVLRDFGLTSAVGGLFHAGFPETALLRRAETGPLDWKALDFENPAASVEVPAAVGDGVPTWGVLQLGFEVKQLDAKVLEAKIGMQTPDMKAAVEEVFKVGFYGDAGEKVTPAVAGVGELPEKASPKTAEFYYWSPTRDFADFPPPNKPAETTSDPFLAATDPVRLTADELAALGQRSSTQQRPIRARSGYKFTVTLYRDNPTPTGPRELDIGPLEKRLSITSPAAISNGVTVTLTGTVTGLVALAGGGGDVNLGEFPSRAGTAKAFALTSERVKLELEPVNADHKDGTIVFRNPPGVTVAADGPPEVANGRKRWGFKVTVAENALAGGLTNQTLVFRDTATGQLVRIPLKGNGHGR